jgi:hypothetical protein
MNIDWDVSCKSFKPWDGGQWVGRAERAYRRDRRHRTGMGTADVIREIGEIIERVMGKASTRSLRPTPALKSARGRFTVVGMTMVWM